MIEFTPPIQQVEYTSYDELRQSVSLLLTDSLRHRFAIIVQTQAYFTDNARKGEAEEIEEFGLADEDEPVFMVSDTMITSEVVDGILKIEPSLLKGYLVPQVGV